jgi:hypothetical protein
VKTILEESWPVSVRNTSMHQRAVSIAFNVRCKALMWLIPGNFTNILRREGPFAESSKALVSTQSNAMVNHVDKRVSKTSFCLEIDGQVNKVIPPKESLLIQYLDQSISRTLARNILQNNGCPLVTFLTLNAGSGL